MMKCPSESEIKAFLDRHDSLPSDREWTEHFDQCARCQKIISKETTEFLGTVPSDGISVTEIAPLLRYFAEGSALKPDTLAKLLLIPKGFANSKKEPPINVEDPDRIDGFDVVSAIGAGGMSRVFLVREIDTQKEFALKLLNADLVTQPELVRRAEYEVAALRRLRHKNIVRFHTHGRWNDRPYLVTEFLHGNDLATIGRATGCFAVPHACGLAIQIARGLAFAHENGVNHRDIKPSNVFVTTDGTVKILDFGVAQFPRTEQQHSLQTPTGYLMGTTEFMAPEQAESLRRADLRSDIYSLGCVLTYLLTGSPVFGRKSHYDTLIAHRTVNAPSLRKSRPEIPEALDAVVLRMLEKDPVNRPSSMNEVIAALRPFADDSIDDFTVDLEGDTVDSKGEITDVEIRILEREPTPTSALWKLILLAGLFLTGIAVLWLITMR